MKKLGRINTRSGEKRFDILGFLKYILSFNWDLSLAIRTHMNTHKLHLMCLKYINISLKQRQA